MNKMQNSAAALRGALMIAALLLVGGPTLRAMPIDRFNWSRDAREEDDARDAQYAAEKAAEAQARAVHRNRWKGSYDRPPGYAFYKYGGYTYYRAGNTYYTPYFYGGRTVYLQVKTQNGPPLPPPAGDTIVIDFGE